MIRVNFLTHEYRQKLFIRKFATFAALILSIVVAIILIVGVWLDMVIVDTTGERNKIISDIAMVKVKTEEIKKATASIEDLSNKIQIIEDILNQKKYGFSEVLFRLQENVPDKVWLKSLTYDGKTLVINGNANSNKDKNLSAERNLLTFERNLRETPAYSNIVPEYSKAIDINGNEIKEFKIIITFMNE